MCNKVSLVARLERIKNYHGIDMDGLDKEMAYGASNFFAFNSILERCDIQQNDEFLDLGSGCGRAVLAASIFHFGTFSIKQAKEHLKKAGVSIR